MCSSSTRRVLPLLVLGLLSLPWGVWSLEGEELRGGVLDLAGPWRAQPGDDPAWAAPGFDDSEWATVPLPASWSEQDLPGHDGWIWYRRSVAPSPELVELARAGDLGLLLGPSIFGAVEVWIEGQRAGRSRGWSLALPMPRETMIALPALVPSTTAGPWTLALRVRSVGWTSVRSPVSGPVTERLLLGPRERLAEGVGYRWSRKLRTDLPLLLLAVVIGVGALYHLLLFVRRPQERFYLWFGLMALAFAVNTLALSWWISRLGPGTGAPGGGQDPPARPHQRGSRGQPRGWGRRTAGLRQGGRLRHRQAPRRPGLVRRPGGSSGDAGLPVDPHRPPARDASVPGTGTSAGGVGRRQGRCLQRGAVALRDALRPPPVSARVRGHRLSSVVCVGAPDTSLGVGAGGAE